jgi:hypothetical protein
MRAKSIKVKTAEQLQSALKEARADGFRPTLAVSFLSSKQDRAGVSKVLAEAGLRIFGATTNGEFIDEFPDTNSIAVLLLDIDPSFFRILSAEYPDKNYREVARRIATETKQAFQHPAFLISGSNLETDAEQLLFGFEDATHKDVTVFGGMAGDDYSFTDQYVFTNGFESHRGMVVLAFDEDKIRIKGRATCGWKAVGTEKTVTKSEGNHVYTVDDVPALDITAKYGGIENVSPDNKGLLMELATNFPLQLQRTTGEPVMRPGLLIDWNDHSFYCSGTVPQGSKVRFSLPPDFDVMEKVIHHCKELKAADMPDADAVIVFSCAGRIVALGPMMNMEIEGIREVWGAPMVGMFSNAELGRTLNGNLEMHNLTTCCVVLKEK